MKRRKIINLQFFAEENEESEENNEGNENNEDESSDVDAAAFADLLSDKDKTIEKLNMQITELKKSNTRLTLQISSGATSSKTIEENILDVVGYKKPTLLE